MRFFHTSHSSGSDDGLWTAIVPSSGFSGFTVATVEVSYWDDLDSSATADYGTYNVMSGYVYVPDPRQPHPVAPWERRHYDEMFSALQSCGWGLHYQSPARLHDDHPFDVFDPYRGDIVAQWRKRRTWILCVAECMWRYGARDIACDISGNNRAALFKNARHAL